MGGDCSEPEGIAKGEDRGKEDRSSSCERESEEGGAMWAELGGGGGGAAGGGEGVVEATVATKVAAFGGIAAVSMEAMTGREGRGI